MFWHNLLITVWGGGWNLVHEGKQLVNKAVQSRNEGRHVKWQGAW